MKPELMYLKYADRHDAHTNTHTYVYMDIIRDSHMSYMYNSSNLWSDGKTWCIKFFNFSVQLVLILVGCEKLNFQLICLTLF